MPLVIASPDTDRLALRLALELAPLIHAHPDPLPPPPVTGDALHGNTPRNRHERRAAHTQLRYARTMRGQQ